MRKLHIHTPLIESLPMSSAEGRKIWLKMENMQPSGSFKLRGIGYACQKYVAQGAKRLLSSSGGNAGLAVAHAGRMLNVPVTVIVPETTKQRAIDLIRLEGAEVVIFGENWDAAHAHALARLDAEGAYLHPFDDPLIWEGHASLVDEVAEAGVIPDAVVLSVGGGGRLCGIAAGLKRNGWGDVPILAVETEGAASLHASNLAKKHVEIEKIASIATSLGAKKVAKGAFDLLSEHSIIPHLVSDADALNACLNFLDDHRTLVEPACGASLAAIYKGCDFLQAKENILVIVCGGVGVTMAELQKWQKDFSGV